MAQTRQQIVDLLASIGREPNRKLGQHFMIERAIVQRLSAEADLGDDPLVLEIGPGTGTLTESLLEAGGEVVAVEIDGALADLVEAEFSTRYPGRLCVIRGDVLTTKHSLNVRMLAKLEELTGPAADRLRPVRLVANLPYNIASPLIGELIGLTWRARHGAADSHVVFDRFVFTVQREVAERLTAEPGAKEYGPLSVLCQGLGQVHLLMPRISPNAFYPKPNVFSSMLRIDLLDDWLARVKDIDALYAWLSAGFGHRRKTLASSIRFSEPWWQVRLTTAAVAAGIDLSRRGETLSVAEYLALAEVT